MENRLIARPSLIPSSPSGALRAVRGVPHSVFFQTEMITIGNGPMKIFAAILIACLPAICLQDTEFTNLQRAFCVLSTPTPPPDPSPVPRSHPYQR